MNTTATEATASTDDRHRRALQRLTLMVLGGLGCSILIVALLVAAALQAVGTIDAAIRAREITQVQRAVAAYGGALNYLTLDAMGGTLDLDRPRLATRDKVAPSELSVSLGGDHVVAWTPHLLGAQTFGQIAPARIALGLVFVLIVAVIAFNVRRVGRELEQKRQEASQLAHTDSLTGVGNRLAFDTALATRLTLAKGFALVLADLDRFKSINDAHGHATGDLILQHVARQLREAGKVEAARLGGDEFAVLCDAADLDDYIDRLRHRLASPIAIDGGELSVGLSLGVARSADFEASPDALMRAADAALYSAKRRGGGMAERASPSVPPRRFAA